MRTRVGEAIEARRVRARERAAALQRDLDDIIERSEDASRDDEHDPEGATIGFERAQVAALIDAAHRELKDLDTATARLQAGIHGICAWCGGEIPVERRLARPTATTCVACA